MILSIIIISAALIVYFRMFFNQHYNSIYFKYMKWKANNQWKLHNKQQFLIPLNNRLILCDNDTKERYNIIARRTYQPRLTIFNIDKMCYYKTPAGNYCDYIKKNKVGTINNDVKFKK